MRRTSLLVVFLTVFIDLLGFGMIVPLLARYGREMGATPFWAGALVGVYSLMQFLFAPVWGRLSDRIGRKPVLAGTLAGNAAAYALYAASSSLPMMFAARALSGLFAANISTAQAYVADVTTREDRAKGMGLIGMAFGLGFVLGPFIGGVLGSRVGLWAPGAAAALLSAVASAIAAFRLPESLPPERRATAPRSGRHPILALGDASRVPGLGGLLALYFFLILGFANLEMVASLFLQDRFGFDEEQSGYVFAYIGVLIAFAQGFLIGRLVRRYGEPRLLLVGPLMIAVGLQLYWLAPNVPAFLAAIPVVAIGMGISNPSVASLISKRTPPDAQGVTLGVSQSLGALARFVAPLLAGWLYQTFPRERGSVAPFVAGGAFVLLGLYLGRRAVREGVPAATPAATVDEDVPPPPPALV